MFYSRHRSVSPNSYIRDYVVYTRRPSLHLALFSQRSSCCSLTGAIRSRAARTRLSATYKLAFSLSRRSHGPVSISKIPAPAQARDLQRMCAYHVATPIANLANSNVAGCWGRLDQSKLKMATSLVEVVVAVAPLTSVVDSSSSAYTTAAR